MIVDTELEKILYLCEEISKINTGKSYLKSWIEKIIVDLGIKIFENNFNRIDGNSNLDIIYIIQSEKFIQLFNRENKLIFCKSRKINNSSYEFIKFTSLLRRRFNINILAFISYSSILTENEICFNIYNSRDLQRYVDFIGLDEIFNELDLKVVNFKKFDKSLQINLSFINPLALDLIELMRYDGIIYDIQISHNTDYSILNKLLLELNKITKF